MSGDKNKMEGDSFSRTFGIEWAEELSDASQPPLVIRLSPNSGKIDVGRSEAAQVCVMDPLLSRHHFQLEQIDGQWTARDLGSKNGTVLNGEMLSEEPQPIASGHVIEAGTSSFQVLIKS